MYFTSDLFFFFGSMSSYLTLLSDGDPEYFILPAIYFWRTNQNNCRQVHTDKWNVSVNSSAKTQITTSFPELVYQTITTTTAAPPKAHSVHVDELLIALKTNQNNTHNQNKPKWGKKEKKTETKPKSEQLTWWFKNIESWRKTAVWCLAVCTARVRSSSGANRKPASYLLLCTSEKVDLEKSMSSPNQQSVVFRYCSSHHKVVGLGRPIMEHFKGIY